MEAFYKRVPKMCKHNNGFTLVPGTVVNQEYPGVWVCKSRCGYYLNFDPDEFLHGIAFTSSPREDKTLPPFKTAL